MKSPGESPVLIIIRCSLPAPTLVFFTVAASLDQCLCWLQHRATWLEHIAGLIPVGDTLLSGLNTFITVALIVVMPFITRMMMPKPSDVVSIDPKLLMEEADFQKQLPKDAPPSERLEESRILTLIIGALGIAYLAMYFSEHGFNITINTVNLMFMIAGLLLHKTPMAYMRAISAAARSTAGILVQFPFYAGIN